MLDLLWDPPLDLEVKASGRNKTHYGMELSPDFRFQGVFLCMCIISVIFYSEFLPLFVLAMIIPLRCTQETKTGYLPCFYCYFHFREQIEGWL